MDNNNLFNEQQDNNAGQQSYGYQNAYQQQGMYQQPYGYQNTYQQQGMYQQPYGQPMGYQQQYGVNQLEQPVSVKEWLITFLILCIPLANFVMPFVWAFGSNSKSSKANYFKAMLIMAGIVVAIYIVLIIVIVISQI